MQLCGYVALWLCSYVAMWLYGYAALWQSFEGMRTMFFYFVYICYIAFYEDEDRNMIIFPLIKSKKAWM